MTLIFPRQDLGTYRKDGPNSTRPRPTAATDAMGQRSLDADLPRQDLSIYQEGRGKLVDSRALAANWMYIFAVNIAVSVGLITAGSTLAGGIIASVTSLKVQRNQIGHQGMLAQAERVGRHTDQRRAIRRDVYVQLLNQLDEVDALILECWQTTPPTIPNQLANEVRTALAQGLRSFDAMINFVKLEGPESVVDAAVQASNTFRGELFYLSALGFDNTGNGAVLHQLAGDNEYSQYFGIRSDAKNSLISAAKLALEETGSDGY